MFVVRRRRSASGFTLPELMAVVAIVGVMGAIAMATLGGAGNGQNSAGLARSLQFAMLNARNSAVGDGFMRRLDCNLATVGTQCNVDKGSPAGSSPTTWATESKIIANSHATIWSVTSSTDTGATTPSQMSGHKYIYFKSDGSVGDATTTTTGMTFYVSDQGGTNTGNHYKVYVYSATGMPRLVNQW